MFRENFEKCIIYRIVLCGCLLLYLQILLTIYDWCTKFIEASKLDGGHFGITENEIENRLIYFHSMVLREKCFGNEPVVFLFFFSLAFVHIHKKRFSKMIFDLNVEIEEKSVNVNALEIENTN